MGNGTYCSTSRAFRSASLGYDTKSAREIFSQRSINNAMNPSGVDIRESRDSDEHPNSVSIILGLDVTGSMGSIPHYLVKTGLPKIMETIIQGGIPDPQLLFLAVGDHEFDNSPLQVGQFESSDELLDHWLTTVYLEGGGGCNDGESYHLAWYFAGFHTAIDCFEKRGKKGMLFTIGDEPVLPTLDKRHLKNIMGNGQYTNFTNVELLDKAREMYHVKHLHLTQGSNGRNPRVLAGWKQLMGDDLIIIERKEDVSSTIADLVIETYANNDFIQPEEFNQTTTETNGNTEPSDGSDEFML